MAKLGSTKNLKIKQIDKEEITVEYLDFLWEYWIKAKAGFKSEISGETELTLQAHHIANKPNKTLRYLTEENGICLTSGEHGFGAHGIYERRIAIENAIKALRGHDIYDRLLELRNSEIKPLKQHEIESFLLGKITPYIDKIVTFYQTKISPKNPDQKHFKRLFKKIAEGSEVIREEVNAE